jgi:hypothetical protein
MFKRKASTKAKGSKALKTGVPKLRDLKPYEAFVSLDIDNFESFKEVFVNAVPEIGRKLAKVNYDHGKASLMRSLAAASNLDAALENIDVANYHKQRATYADFNGFEQEVWQYTDNCGNVGRWDFQDLYDSPKFEVIIRVTTPLKDKADLAKRGVK